MNEGRSSRSRTAGRGERRRTALSESERDRTVDLLCRQFAADALGLEELERRIDRAHTARSADELTALVSDLPALPAEGEEGAESAEPESTTVSASRASDGSVAPPADHARRTGYAVACLGGVERAGHWTPPRHLIAGAVMGGTELDFRQATLPPGETRITVICLMGGVEIIVPPGLPVDASGVAVLGGFEHAERAAPPGDPDVPWLRITGVALMGGVSVEERRPGESARDARRRRKAERKRLREASARS